MEAPAVSELQPFALALSRRRGGPGGQFSTTTPLSRSYDSRPSRSIEFADSAPLRAAIADLEQQIAALALENGQLGALTSELAAEKAKTSRLGDEHDRIFSEIAREEDRTQTLTDQVAQLQTLIVGKDRLIDAKESLINTLHDEYEALQEDYHHSLDIYAHRISAMRVPMTPPRFPVRDDFDRDYRAARTAPVSPVALPPPVTERRHVSSPIIARPPVNRAMQDNIVFGEGDRRAGAGQTIETDRMTMQELRTSLDGLQRQKDMLESQLQRSPPKNMTQAEVKRDREATNEQFELVSRNISKLKLQLMQKAY
jgi:hypothetical protein